MSARLAFRLAAAGFALLAILVAALQARRPALATRPVTSTIQSASPVDPRLSRCQALGAAGAQEPQCLQAWDEARSRFLGASKAGR